MNGYESGGIAPPFLTSALDEGEWSASRSCRFTPGERALGTHYIGGWVDPVWRLWSREITLAPGGNRTPAVHLLGRRYTN
jgi:hypothetical protein